MINPVLPQDFVTHMALPTINFTYHHKTTKEKKNLIIGNEWGYTRGGGRIKNKNEDKGKKEEHTHRRVLVKHNNENEFSQ